MPIEITVPGSKSIANRALILRALLNKDIDIQNIPDCDDTKYMLKALKELQSSNKSKINLFTGNAGTTTRFLTAFCSLENKQIKILGDSRMSERPIKPLTDALKKLGAVIKSNKGCPPLKIFGGLKGGTISIPGNISSQYISALIMIAPFTKKKTTINIEQELCSKPYVDMTIKVMKRLGISTVNKNFKQFKPGKVSAAPEYFTIEGDASSASYPGAFAAIHRHKTVTLKNITKKSLQGDIKFLQYLEKMGCKINHLKNSTKVRGPKKLNPLGTIDMNKTPDLVMTFATLAMFTTGKTLIKNIGNLRIKETDRLQALENEIKKFGITAKTGKDYIEIHGDPDRLKKINKRISIKTYNDHRIAMCFGILTDIIPTLHIQNPKCVSKSYPQFWEDLKKLQNG